MKTEILELFKKENFKNLNEEEKNLINELFTEVVVDENLDGSINSIDFRYHINERFTVECYGKEIEEPDPDSETVEFDFSESNYFRFYENGEETELNHILEIENKLNTIYNLEIEFNDLLYDFYDYNHTLDNFKIVGHQDYIIEKMPGGFFDENGELNLEYDVNSWTYEDLLDFYIDILEEEIADIEEKMHE